MIDEHHPEVWDYLPDRCEIHRVKRQWLADVIFSTIGTQFVKWRDELMKARSNKVAIVRNLDIAVTKVALDAFKSSYLVASKKGRAWSILKSSSNRRRTAR